jgi:hypothetical protein
MRLLLDENVPALLYEAITRSLPQVTVEIIGRPEAPPKGTLDPEILAWCEHHECLLLTNNRRSMPLHLRDHLQQGGHHPGILVFNWDASLSAVVEDLVILLEASRPEELFDQIRYLPLT